MTTLTPQQADEARKELMAWCNANLAPSEWDVFEFCEKVWLHQQSRINALESELARLMGGDKPLDIIASFWNRLKERDTTINALEEENARLGIVRWQNCKKVMPKADTLYFITDGDTWALAMWNIENMWWDFKYHKSVFKATHFMEVKIPKPPTDQSKAITHTPQEGKDG